MPLTPSRRAVPANIGDLLGTFGPTERPASGASFCGVSKEMTAMVTESASGRTAGHTEAPAYGRSATRVVVAVLGAVVGLAGVEHGVGEFLQGPVRPGALIIASWPDAAALEILSGEPALTVVPNLLVTGVLAVIVGLAVAAWSIWFAARRRGGSVLIALSLLLLLVGGGLAPPVMGIVLGSVAARMRTMPHRAPASIARAIAPAWPWFLAAALFGYLGLMPGMVLADAWGVASETLVIGLAAVAFTGFGLALLAARAHDRPRPLEVGMSGRLP
jgi:hypothetical protein